MRADQILKIKIVNSLENKTSEGTVQIQNLNKKERTNRALKFWGICWGLSIVTVLLPILHFLLVPGFFIAGPIAFYFVLQQDKLIIGGQGTCPNCAAPLTIAKSTYRFPLNEECKSCQHNLSIDLI